jgi:Plavaka transposase
MPVIGMERDRVIQKSVTELENVLGSNKICLVGTNLEVGYGTMGYSNKRRRSKRRRTRKLNALQNNTDLPDNESSSSQSSVDVLEQNSSYASFHSTQSQHSYMNNDACLIPPNSIFLDDVNDFILHDDDLDHEMQLDNRDNDQVSVADIENVDQFLNYQEDTSVDDISSAVNDDISIQSATSPLGNGHSAHHQHHCFDRMSRDETASYKIMSLLDTAGAPRICYDRLVALLKTLSKQEGFDVKKALNRETLMRRMERRYKSRPRIESAVVNNQEVFRFNFHDTLQDLLHSSGKHLHEILPDRVHANAVVIEGTEHELWNTPWMRNTFAMEQYLDFDPKNDIMLPIILYMDKTGTDVNQRYSLEPVLFSVSAISREQRESRHSWRHLGFVPQKQRCSEEESSSDLQFYHNCLSYLLDGLRAAQKNPPTVIVKNGSDLVERRALLPLMVVMGDQLSQDTLCGRLKSNSGGAGRVHRNCMCSYLNVDDPYHTCKKVDSATLHLLTKNATITEQDISVKIRSNPIFSSTVKHARTTRNFLLKQRNMFRTILRHPFTAHPVKNAFDGINFGSWPGGIHDATFDDFMHSVEAGMVSYITETVYDGLTKKEKETVEELTRPLLDDQRCSVNSNYPRWRLQPGFTRQTLMTSGERVGSVLALSLSLQDPIIRETIRTGHLRQVQKYLDLSTESLAETKKRETESETVELDRKPPPQPPPPEFYLDQHMHTLDDQGIRHTLEHMIRHGFQVQLLDDLDPFQINQMLRHCVDLFKNTQYPENYPIDNIDESYTDMGEHLHLPKEQFVVVKYAMQTKPSKLMKDHRLHKVEGTTGKHLKKKAHKKGEGSSAAVLTSKMGTLVIFLEYVLSYHAFCKYSWSLPVFLQRSYGNIKAGNRFVVEYFQKLIYRGSNTVDSRFPKIHSQCRMGQNTEEMNTVMNFCCETGERLLKTEAKGISRTAQQRGNDTFLTQTMSRLQDRSVLDCFAMYLDEKVRKDDLPGLEQCDRLGRTHPHFLFDVVSDQIYALNRKREKKKPDDKSGYLACEVTDALKKHDPHTMRFEIYNEVVLRDTSRLRASPNYANSGPWYDYANVTWEKMEHGIVESYLLPAKCLCFYHKVCEETGVSEIMALIHTVKPYSRGRTTDGRIDTLLTKNYQLEFDKRGNPVTHIVPVASIDSSVRCFPHVPGKQLFNPNSPGITYLLPRNHWAYMWMALNDALIESNSHEKIKQRKGKLIALCNTQWLEHVRERYQNYLRATSMEDL